MTNNYKEMFQVGDRVILVSNPDNPQDNGKIGVVTDIRYEGMKVILNGDDRAGLYRRSVFRHPTKLDKALR